MLSLSCFVIESESGRYPISRLLSTIPSLIQYSTGCLPHNAWYIAAAIALTRAGPSITDEQYSCGTRLLTQLLMPTASQGHLCVCMMYTSFIKKKAQPFRSTGRVPSRHSRSNELCPEPTITRHRKSGTRTTNAVPNPIPTLQLWPRPVEPS
eukprot:1232461-Rhodomonas_salina.1